MRRWAPHILLAAVLAAVAAPTVACAAPGRPPAAPVHYTVTATDTLTTNAVDLLISLTAAQAEISSIDARISVVATQAAEQSATLDAAVRAYEDAQSVYDERAVEMYMSGDYDLLSILLDADSFSDLITRLEVVTRVLEADRWSLQELEIVADQARFQSARLEALVSEKQALEAARAQRAMTVSTAQPSLASLELQLAYSGDLDLDAIRNADLAYRALWRAASVPVTQTVPVREVRVLPHPATYVSSKFHYTRYRSTDIVFNAAATWYGADFNGCVTASGQTFNAADYTCAHPSLPMGTWLAVTRTDPGTQEVFRVIVVVNDRGPYGSNRDLQLSRAAADVLQLTAVGSGVVACEVVRPIP